VHAEGAIVGALRVFAPGRSRLIRPLGRIHMSALSFRGLQLPWHRDRQRGILGRYSPGRPIVYTLAPPRSLVVARQMK
jgi:hypothetical protein